ncbi:hypothetical protein [Kitasatospora sp. CB01950]|uniref:hypothetical protein n=1 Tax=Kitasatospora sp. CB01950 TaxID=1703930 RepID=UPI00093CDCA0|nr:hypothetical protein [Kitasatospora sp. CB01950]OKJ01119.1 hypothetical protein AMK19_28805 [Kitasatospora sp. CB01950]
MIIDRAVALRRLTLPGYRGPLLLTALLAAVVALPEGVPHLAMVFAAVAGGLFLSGLTAAPLTAPLAMLPFAFPVLLIAVVVIGATVERPLTRPRRPGTSALLGLALGCAAVVLGFSLPGWDYGLLGVGGLTLVGLPFAWLLWQQQPAARNAESPSGRWRWAVAPLLVAATVLTVTRTDPAEARFALARPALTDWAEHALATGTAEQGWVAGYHLTEPELTGGGVKFAIPGTGVFAPHGLAYFPPGTTLPAKGSYVPLGDGWYDWEEHDRF